MLIAAGSVDITPDRPLSLAGYLPPRMNATIGSGLTIAIVAFRDVSGETAVIVSADLLYFGAELASRIEHFLKSEFGISSANVLLAASHTHFAPATDRAKPLLGTVDDRYLETVWGKVETLLRKVVSGPFVDATLGCGVTLWNGGVYRRRPWRIPHFYRRILVFGEPVMAPNPSERIERRLRLWTLCGEDRQPLAILWQVACHPTGNPEYAAISSDFVGAVRSRLQADIERRIPILFLQGFSGDIQPRVCLRRVRTVPDLFRYAMFGPAFEKFHSNEWDAWSANVADCASRALASASSAPMSPIDGQIIAQIASVPLDRVVVTASARKEECVFKRLQIGDAIDIFSVTAEVSDGFRMTIPVVDAVTVGCAGDCFGYWPTDRQRREGGYEGGRYLPAFSRNGRLGANLDALFVEAIGKLTEDAQAPARPSSLDLAQASP